MDYLQDVSIKPFLDSNIATILEASECCRFNNFISENYPWIEVSQTRINWGKIPRKERIKWGHDSTEDEVGRFIEYSLV